MKFFFSFFFFIPFIIFDKRLSFSYAFNVYSSVDDECRLARDEKVLINQQSRDALHSINFASIGGEILNLYYVYVY